MTKTTATAHTNIALIKYWGKKDAQLNLPTTSSLSLTLDEFYTTTTVKNSNIDQLIINGQMADPTRVHHFLDGLRAELGDFSPLLISSQNHVPTAAGLASSASAFAALTAAATRHLGLDLPLTTLSRLARRGSGSATRSLFGGFALWQAGTNDQTSYANALPTPNIPISLLVVEISGLQKKISSSEGMQRAMTSPNYEQWVHDANWQITAMQAALQASDLTRVGQLAEDNALAMHALNLSAKDRRFTYFTPQTIQVLDLVKKLRQAGLIAYATLDAGPNVKIITHSDQAAYIQAQLHQELPKLRVTIAHPGPGVSYEQ
ncbi:diphosphomevalonate decarboxylase [Convivina intestini]|uniref:diphosphomevalonate decarboxylase n=1 Tax=Convivina intestini TaxID=1505726 RepID=UPI0020106A0E|nr:diphosphomevalonate decarboxylase [Convivina intestini]CAH1854961.1 hypothetical protein R078131_01114 [Convivina intestini]